MPRDRRDREDREYKRQAMRDLAQGSREKLPNEGDSDYQDFDDFARRSSREERRSMFKRSFHPDQIPSSRMEPELQQAISQIDPQERDDVAREFISQLGKRGLSDRDLEQRLRLSTHDAKHMSADDVSKLAAFTYHSHPDIFQDVLADKPGILKFLSNPLIGAALGAVAAKWLGGRQ